MAGKGKETGKKHDVELMWAMRAGSVLTGVWGQRAPRWESGSPIAGCRCQNSTVAAANFGQNDAKCIEEVCKHRFITRTFIDIRFAVKTGGGGGAGGVPGGGFAVTIPEKKKNLSSR